MKEITEGVPEKILDESPVESLDESREEYLKEC